MKVNRRASMGKVGLTLFFDDRCALLVEFIHRKKRINSYDYTDTLMRLYNRKCKQLGLLTLQPAFHHYSARPHMVVTLSGILESLKPDSVEQLPYSLDLAPADFHIFGFLKKDLAGLASILNLKLKRNMFVNAGADRPDGISGVSRCALCTNVAPAPCASNKKQLSFYCVISKLNNEKWLVLQTPSELRLKQYAVKKAPCLC